MKITTSPSTIVRFMKPICNALSGASYDVSDRNLEIQFNAEGNNSS